jgi:cation transport ATPase
LARIQAIIRDKTGTLTVGALAVNDSLNFAPGGRLAAASPSPEGVCGPLWMGSAR